MADSLYITRLEFTHWTDVIIEAIEGTQDFAFAKEIRQESVRQWQPQS